VNIVSTTLRVRIVDDAGEISADILTPEVASHHGDIPGGDAYTAPETAEYGRYGAQPVVAGVTIPCLPVVVASAGSEELVLADPRVLFSSVVLRLKRRVLVGPVRLFEYAVLELLHPPPVGEETARVVAVAEAEVFLEIGTSPTLSSPGAVQGSREGQKSEGQEDNLVEVHICNLVLFPCLVRVWVWEERISQVALPSKVGKACVY